MTTTARTYIKPASKTQLSASEFLQTVAATCRLAGITKDYRNEVLFETGCAFVEYYIQEQNAIWRTYLLTREDSGFWAWWLTQFVKDDEALVRYNPQLFSDVDYREIKLGMLRSTDIYNDFVNLLEYITKKENGKV